MARQQERFTLTTEHIKLLRRLYVERPRDDFSAPQINAKRPYGNSDVVRDIIEILGWEWSGDEFGGPSETAEHARRLHRQLSTALQIVLVEGTMHPGEYTQVDEYDARSWVRVAERSSGAASNG